MYAPLKIPVWEGPPVESVHDPRWDDYCEFLDYRGEVEAEIAEIERLNVRKPVEQTRLRYCSICLKDVDYGDLCPPCERHVRADDEGWFL